MTPGHSPTGWLLHRAATFAVLVAFLTTSLPVPAFALRAGLEGTIQNGLEEEFGVPPDARFAVSVAQQLLAFWLGERKSAARDMAEGHEPELGRKARLEQVEAVLVDRGQETVDLLARMLAPRGAISESLYADELRFHAVGVLGGVVEAHLHDLMLLKQIFTLVQRQPALVESEDWRTATTLLIQGVQLVAEEYYPPHLFTAGLESPPAAPPAEGGLEEGTFSDQHLMMGRRAFLYSLAGLAGIAGALTAEGCGGVSPRTVPYSVPSEAELPLEQGEVRARIRALGVVVADDPETRLRLEELELFEELITQFQALGLIQGILELVIVKPLSAAPPRAGAEVLPQQKAMVFYVQETEPRGQRVLVSTRHRLQGAPPTQQGTPSREAVFSRGPIGTAQTFAHELGHLVMFHHSKSTFIQPRFSELHRASSRGTYDFIRGIQWPDALEDFAETFTFLALFEPPRRGVPPPAGPGGILSQTYTDLSQIFQNATIYTLAARKLLLLMEYFVEGDHGRMLAWNRAGELLKFPQGFTSEDRWGVSVNTSPGSLELAIYPYPLERDQHGITRFVLPEAFLPDPLPSTVNPRTRTPDDPRVFVRPPTAGLESPPAAPRAGAEESRAKAQQELLKWLKRSLRRVTYDDYDFEASAALMERLGYDVEDQLDEQRGRSIRRALVGLLAQVAISPDQVIQRLQKSDGGVAKLPISWIEFRKLIDSPRERGLGVFRHGQERYLLVVPGTSVAMAHRRGEESASTRKQPLSVFANIIGHSHPTGTDALRSSRDDGAPLQVTALGRFAREQRSFIVALRPDGTLELNLLSNQLVDDEYIRDEFDVEEGGFETDQVVHGDDAVRHLVALGILKPQPPAGPLAEGGLEEVVIRPDANGGWQGQWEALQELVDRTVTIRLGPRGSIEESVDSGADLSWWPSNREFRDVALKEVGPFADASAHHVLIEGDNLPEDIPRTQEDVPYLWLSWVKEIATNGAEPTSATPAEGGLEESYEFERVEEFEASLRERSVVLGTATRADLQRAKEAGVGQVRDLPGSSWVRAEPLYIVVDQAMFESGRLGPYVARWNRQAYAADPRAAVELIPSTRWTGQGLAVGIALKDHPSPVSDIPTIEIESYDDLSKINARGLHAVTRPEFYGQRLPPVVAVLNYKDAKGADRTAIFL